LEKLLNLGIDSMVHLIAEACAARRFDGSYRAAQSQFAISIASTGDEDRCAVLCKCNGTTATDAARRAGDYTYFVFKRLAHFWFSRGSLNG
jgi:hypothetical protein